MIRYNVIGITGGIGSGKSSVAKILKNMGATILDTDLIYSELTGIGMPLTQRLCMAFGREMLLSDGNLNRKNLADLVFKNHKKLKLLNHITHPAICHEVNVRIKKIRSGGISETIVVEAPVYVEALFSEIVDETWVIVAPIDLRIERIKQRNNLTQEEILNRISMQKNDQEYMRVADRIILNDSDYDNLYNTVTNAYKDYLTSLE